MGEPMARNLARAGIRLAVWNRSEPPTRWFRDHHVAVSGSVDEIFESCPTIILMLANGEAADEVLGRRTPEFARRVRGRTIVNMGTVAPAFSEALAADIRSSGGRFVECPVSGSRLPAEEGTLVAMLAGGPDRVDEIRDLVAPMCARAFVCDCDNDARQSGFDGEVEHGLTIIPAIPQRQSERGTEGDNGQRSPSPGHRTSYRLRPPNVRNGSKVDISRYMMWRAALPLNWRILTSGRARDSSPS
jgi:hypothetical protein